MCLAWRRKTGHLALTLFLARLAAQLIGDSLLDLINWDITKQIQFVAPHVFLFFRTAF